MKTIKSFIGLAFVLFASFFVVSCNDDVKETLEQQWALVLDNYDCNYDYSDDGKCFGDGGGIGKENFDKVFVGHGWKHYGTWEIDKNGKDCLSNIITTQLVYLQIITILIATLN